jgi:hypothetical protein
LKFHVKLQNKLKRKLQYNNQLKKLLVQVFNLMLFQVLLQSNNNLNLSLNLNLNLNL